MKLARLLSLSVLLGACSAPVGPTDGRTVVAEFTGHVDAHGNVTITKVTPRVVMELPIAATGTDVVRLETSSSSVSDLASDCGRINTLCADVTVQSLYATAELRGLYVEIDTISSGTNAAFGYSPAPAYDPTANTSIGLWVYGNFQPNDRVTRTWKFNLPSATSFTFTGRVVADVVSGGSLIESCGFDGIDEDGDGAIDCADADCEGQPACTSEICGNGNAGNPVDDDLNGLADCADFNCSGNPQYCGGVVVVPGTKVVFGINSVTQGSGIAAYDALCESTASGSTIDPDGSKMWRAWLSTSTESAATRLAHSTVPYVRPDGATVADDWDDLVDGSLQNPILTDINGARLTGNSIVIFAPPVSMVWTGSTHEGQLGTANCLDWTSVDVAQISDVGDFNSTSATWSANTTTGCAVPPIFGGASTPAVLAMYCFEQ